MSTPSSGVQERQLQLLAALDKARDSIDDSGDPMAMFKLIVRALKDHFQADAVTILLIDAQLQEIESVSAVGMPQNMAIKLGRDALAFKEPLPLVSSAWKYTLGLQILVEREQYIPGSIVLARRAEAFTDEDIELLKLAESQIDSAVVQARTMWRLADRNRELEAIYQIDRLRDDAYDEDHLYTSFTGLLTRHFEATLCQIIVAHSETGEPITRSIVDKRQLSTTVQEAIAEKIHDLQTTTILEGVPGDENLQLLAAPFIVAGERLGAVVVGRDEPYTVNDTRLMVAMTSQMDSAIAKNRTTRLLEQRTRELESIYRIDEIRDQAIEFEDLLQQVLVELCNAITSETGYIMLYNETKEEVLEMRATTRDGLITNDAYKDIIGQVSREAMDTEKVVTYNDVQGDVNSIVAVPLILNRQVIGVFGAINSSNPRGFGTEDGRMLSAITSQVDTAIFERMERRRMRQVLSRSVDPKVLEALLQRADDSVLAGERVVLTCLFADIRGSTEWAERTDPEELVKMLNTFLGLMTDVIFKHNGTLDKFVGDEVIALFGSPVEMDNHAYLAAQAALEMQAVHQRMQRELKLQGREIPPIGIGVSSGEVIAGEFGPPIRTDFTAMGHVMNLGARLCSAAVADQIIISQTTYDMTKQFATVRELEPITPKGIAQPVSIFELKGMIDDF